MQIPPGWDYELSLRTGDDGRYSAEVRISEGPNVRCKLVLPTQCTVESEALAHVDARVRAWLTDWVARSESGFTPL